MPSSLGNYQIVVDSAGVASGPETQSFIVERGQLAGGRDLLRVHESRAVSVYGPIRCEAAPLALRGGASSGTIASFKASGQPLFTVTDAGMGVFPNGVKLPALTAANLIQLNQLHPGSIRGQTNIVIITDAYLTGTHLGVWTGSEWKLFGPMY